MDDLYFQRTGQGDDVLLIHGWASSSLMWNSTIAAMADHYTFWTVDLPGFGQSPLPDSFEPTIDGYLELLLAFCDEHELAPRAIVGHSMGGLLALRLALARPEWGVQLALICPVVTGSFGLFNISRIVGSGPARMILARTGPGMRLLQWGFIPEILTITHKIYNSQAFIEEAVMDFRRMHWRAAVQSALSITHIDLRPELAAITQPVMIIVGNMDYTVPASESRIAAQGLPNAQLHVFKGCHHQPYDEKPERYLSLLEAFLTGDTAHTTADAPL